MNDRIDEMYAAPKEQGGATAIAFPAGKDVAGWVLVAIPPLSGIVSGLLAGTGVETIVSLAMVIGCAFAAGIDARRWGFRSAALGMVLLFIVFYPVHFYRRGKNGAPLGLVAGVAALMLWFGLMVVMIVLRGGASAPS